jgi:hypothetical protein
MCENAENWKVARIIFLRSTEIGLTKECLCNYRRLGERFFCRYRARFSFYTAKTLTGLGRGRTRSCFVTYDIVRQTDPRLSRAPPNVAVDFNALGIIQCTAGYE